MSVLNVKYYTVIREHSDVNPIRTVEDKSFDELNETRVGLGNSTNITFVQGFLLARLVLNVNYCDFALSMSAD